MRYQGGKSKIAKHISALINEIDLDRYYEPFVGGASVLELVEKKHRYASDNCPDLIAMWRAIQYGWKPPSDVSRDEYQKLRARFCPEGLPLRGFVGYGCSWGAKFFGGYASGEGRNFADESARSIERTKPLIKDVVFDCHDYARGIGIGAEPMVIYCDPPYEGTTGYSGRMFEHDLFWAWCDVMVQRGHKVLVSELQAPDDWEIVWEKEAHTSGYVNGGTATVSRTERLYTK